MSNAPLPSQVDLRKLAAKGAEIHAESTVADLPRVVDMLANDSGTIAVDLHFYTDEEHIRRLDGCLTADVEVYCQRCLEPMPLHLEADFALGMAWSEADSKRLPAVLDPLIVGEELTDLADVVSEELILNMPFVSYHADDQCAGQGRYSAGGGAEPVASGVSEQAGGQRGESRRDNPFKVLEQLKRNK